MTREYDTFQINAPFHPSMCRAGGQRSVSACCGIVCDGVRHEARRDGRLLRLGRIEYGMLELLLANRGMVFSRDALVDILWDGNQSIDLRTVDVHIGRLRRALTLRCAPNPIQTVRGKGYAIELTCEDAYHQWIRHPAKLRLRSDVGDRPARMLGGHKAMSTRMPASRT